MIKVRVTDRVGVADECGQLPQALANALKQEFTHDNPEYDRKRKLGLPYWSEPREILTWQAEPWPGISVPRGGLKRVLDIVAELGFQCACSQRDPVLEGGRLTRVTELKVQLRDYQEEAVRAMVDARYGILRAPTGSGKTLIGMAIAARLRVRTIVIVPNQTIFDQWVARAVTQMGLAPDEIGIVRGPKRRLRPLTIAMQQTLARRGIDDELDKYFDCVVCDEVQLFAARTFFKVVDAFSAPYRFGMSADHKRKDGKEFLALDLIGPVRHDIKRKGLLEAGHVVDVDVLVVPTAFRADWYRLPDDESDVDAALNFNLLVESMMGDEPREALVVDRVVREAELGGPVIVMAHRREHCRAIDRSLVERGYRTGFLIGGPDYRDEFLDTVTRLERGEVQVAVGTYKAVGMGFDLPSARSCVCATPVAGNRQLFTQVVGRVCRPSAGKKTARLVYLWDELAPYGIRHLRNLIAWNDRAFVLRSGNWVQARKRGRDAQA